ncbi:MAG: Panacea domain-containing protein [Dehalococcoidia bacterium]|jgi:uncharacterized phage-associated protein
MTKIILRFNYKKAAQALNRLAVKQGGRINKMKAFKLIYLADRYHFRKYGRLITNDNYVAMKNGPVPSQTRDIVEQTTFIGDEEKEYSDRYIENKGQHDLISRATPDDKVFSESDIEALDFAWENFGKYDQFQLRDIVHKYPDWAKHKEVLDKKISLSVPMDLDGFFDDPTASDADKCFALKEEDKEIRREYFQDIVEIESIWR